MRTFLLTCLILSISILTTTAQSSAKQVRKENLAFRETINAEFRDSIESPLLPADRLSFKKLAFFPIKAKYRVTATLRRTPEASPFEMPRTKGNTGTYRKYGEATFTLRGQQFTVCVYQYLKLMDDEKYARHLFLPFGDLTNAESTYGSGRFIDLTIPEGDTLIIDFNQAYNPLCAYNSKYSCPIPPIENQITLKIPAGVRKYRKHHE